jgi:succinyl-CoA synthetase alpha subunit
MAILIDEHTKVVVQGLTGKEGQFHALRNRAYGTKVVAGTRPGKGGEQVEGIPIFDTVAQAVEATGANTSLIFVPPPFAADAVLEAAAAGVAVIVCITEGIPAQDEAKVFNYLKETTPDTVLIGPNCPGLISPGKSNVGIMPDAITAPGNIGVVSRSGTLTYQAVHELTTHGLGQTTCIGIGGDPVPGTSFVDILVRFQDDPDTEGIVLIGEIGGDAEEQAARFIEEHVTKPVVAYIAGVTAPAGKRMGHAGAIISGSKGTAAAKMDALRAAGVTVLDDPTTIGQAMKGLLGG